MKRKLWIAIMVFASMFLLTACSNKEDNQENSSTSAVDSSVLEEEIPDIGNAVADSRGVWTYNQILVYHASDNKRYLLEESSDGTLKDKNNKSYAFQEYDNRVFAITPAEDKLVVKEGKYAEENVGSKDSPGGYKPMMITYKKSDLFDLDALEQAITGKIPDAGNETENKNEAKQGDSESEESQSDPDSQEISATDATNPVTEEETQDNSDSAEISAETLSIEESAIYAEIYQNINDFMLTDNFKQKDPGNRALELFNHLHNLAHANIDQDSIINDTENQEVRFNCYEKYTITVNVADSVITVSEKED